MPETPVRPHVDPTVPDFYDDPDEIIAWIHDNEPVLHCAGKASPWPFWIISKFDDVKRVLANPDLFTSRYGEYLGGSLMPGASHVADGMPDDPRLEVGMKIMGLYDPKPHRKLRGAINQDFRAGIVIRKWEDTTRRIVVEEIESHARGEVIDFVEAIARRIPLRLIASMLGLDPSRSADYERWTRAVMASLQPGVLGSWETVVEMFDYFEAELNRRSQSPQDDLLSTFVGARDSGAISNDQAIMLAWEMMAAGIDTTVYLLGSGLQAILERPEQRQLLFSDPGRVPKATAEMLRWSTPIRYHARRAEQDTQIRGVEIAKGEWVTVNFLMANRDPELFVEPFSFDIARTTRPGKEHVSFGYGQHFCIGAGVAKLEARVVLEEIIARCPDIALAGDAVYRPETLVNGLEHLPVALRP